MAVLSPEEGMLAVHGFLQGIWEQTRKVGDLGFFCDIVSYVPGDGTADPAMWYDWLAWARQVQTGDLVPENTGRRGSLTPADVSPLTPELAYQAMFRFIEEYYLRISRPPELGDLLGRMRYTTGAGTADPEMWQRWLAAIGKV